MSIQIPKPNVLDRFLELFGKKRGTIIPFDVYKKHGQFVYASAKKESFWNSLFRSKSEKLPKRVIDINFLNDKDSSESWI